MRYCHTILLMLLLAVQHTTAQEINAKVSINHQQLGNMARTEVFDDLQNKVTNFLNEHKWTEMQFRETERINCSLTITINTYSDTDNAFTCSMQLTVSRPVFNSSYTTTIYSLKDNDFDFTFQNTDALEYAGPDRLDNNLVALLSYYAYMIIGYDMDCMAPQGGTPYFHIAEDIVTNAENLGYTGWKAFGDNNNRFALLNDYLDGGMECYRQLMYDYHRKGLDQMADNVDTGRDAIKEALSLLDQAHEAKNMSHLPQLFTEYKKDELVNIFHGKGSNADREAVYDILFGISPSQSTDWDKIKQ